MFDKTKCMSGILASSNLWPDVGIEIHRSGSFMTIDLTRDEIWLLKALRAAGVRGRTVSALASDAGFARLTEIHYVTKHPQSGRKTLYVITDRDRQALANAPQ